jgi:YD repeat-containing protein
VAEAINASPADIAFTSFEADGKGNWTFTGTPVADAAALTGGKDYNLSSGSISKSGLNTSRSYIVSYWSKTGSATVNGSTASAVVSRNGWTYYEHKLAAGASSITVSGSVSIDELRLYPSDAQMTTYTYDVLAGMTSQSDINNRITYYLYDAFGRLKAVKDQDGNVIKTVEYHYQNQTAY